MKKITSLILTLILIFSLNLSANAEIFTSSDALTILRAAAGLITLTTEQQAKYDLDSDDKITTADAVLVLKIVAGTFKTNFKAFAEWLDYMEDESDKVKEVLNVPKKDTVTFFSSYHGWWGIDSKQVTDPEVSKEFNKLRENFKPIEPFDFTEDNIHNLYPSGIFCFDDGAIILLLSGNKAVMGYSLDEFNQYFELSDEFIKYYHLIRRAYPNRFYEGTIKNGILNYELIYAGKDKLDYDLILTSLTENDDNTILTAKFDVKYSGNDAKVISLYGFKAYSDDNLSGMKTQEYTITKNTSIEFTIEIYGKDWNAQYFFQTESLAYSIWGKA